MSPVTSAGSDYDRMVRELLYERKARATDSLKTVEELAREQREKLVEMEVHTGVLVIPFWFQDFPQ